MPSRSPRNFPRRETGYRREPYPKGKGIPGLRRKKKPRKKIKFLNELGVDPETGEFITQDLKKTHTLQTGEFNREDAQTWLEAEKASIQDFRKTGRIKRLTFRMGLELWAKLAPNDLSRKRRPGKSRSCTSKTSGESGSSHSLGDTIIESAPQSSLIECVENYKNTPGPYGPHNIGGVRDMVIDLNTQIYFLRRKEIIKKHPDLPVLPEMDTPKIHFIPPDRLLEVIERFDRRIGYDLFGMLYIRSMGFGGLRTENARTLRKEFFNREEGTFDTGPTKNGKSYILPIPDELKGLLDRVPDFDKPGPLFNGTKGKIRGYGWYLNTFKQVCRSMGLSNTRAWHTLRASYATFLIRSGVDLVIVKELLTHETLVMVLRYAGIGKRDLAQAQVKGSIFLREAQEQRRNRAGNR